MTLSFISSSTSIYLYTITRVYAFYFPTFFTIMPPPNPDDPYCDGCFQRKPGSQYSLYPATAPPVPFPPGIEIISCTRCSQPLSYDSQLESLNRNPINHSKSCLQSLLNIYTSILPSYIIHKISLDF